MRESYIYRKFIAPILHINDTAESIALGTAVGIFLGLTPTVGIQMVLIIMIGSVIPANRLAGLVTVYISNPFTMLPIYWADYAIGAKAMGMELMTREAFAESWDQIQAEFAVGWWDGVQAFFTLNVQVIGPMFLGGAIFGLVVAIPVYPLTLRAVRAQQRRRAKKQALLQMREAETEEEKTEGEVDHDRHRAAGPSAGERSDPASVEEDPPAP